MLNTRDLKEAIEILKLINEDLEKEDLENKFYKDFKTAYRLLKRINKEFYPE